MRYYSYLFTFIIVLSLGISSYYYSVEKKYVATVVNSTETYINVDALRFAFKTSRLTNQGLISYLYAVKNQDEEKVYDTIDLFEAAIGFAHIEYTYNKKLHLYVQPRIERCIEIIEKEMLLPSKKDITALHQLTSEINDFVEFQEKETWKKIQDKYFENEDRQRQQKVLSETINILLVLIVIGLGLFILLLYRKSKALSEANYRLSISNKIFASTKEGIFITNLDGKITEVNTAFTDITGYEAQEVIGKNPSILKSGDYDQEFYTKMWKELKEKGSWQGEIKNRDKYGKKYPQWLNISTINNDKGKPQYYVSIFSDISDLKEHQEKLYNLAYHDVLTGLANRRLFHARLEHTLSMDKRRGLKTAVIFLDIDNFKNVNDSYGHHVGNQLIIDIAKRLSIHIRENDTLARVGGDEFIIVMGEFHDLDAITQIIEKIMELFEKPFILDNNQEFWATMSVGVSISPEDTTSSDLLMENADTAMYVAKQNGKNMYKYFNEKMSHDAYERITLQSALKAAVLENQFEVYYQPQIDVTNNSLIGLEALVRWNSPEFGFVTPDKFIPAAESSRLIIEIGEFVLKQVCLDIQAWKKQNIDDIKVAINFSGVQFDFIDVPGLLNNYLKKYEIDPKCIEIEITESMIMGDSQKWSVLLHKIRDIGIQISIDDFGTGYSSLSHLTVLPVDTLKIDKSFVMNLPDDVDACNIVQAVINMSKSLGLRTLAEGVETKEQLEYLKSLGCDYIQGYFISKPKPKVEIDNWLLQRKS